MDKYSKHFLLNVNTAKEYVVEKVGYFKEDEKLEAIEIGVGNINYVFKVWNPETGKSPLQFYYDAYQAVFLMNEEQK